MMRKFLDNLQSIGIYTFSRETVKKQLNLSEEALKKTLQRYEKKRRILKIRKKFYIIIPLEYKNIGILPPFWFIDDLMKYINTNYYVGLVSAANIYGASHQQPQIFQVITNKQLNTIKTKQIKIEFITKKIFPMDSYIKNKKVETGNIRVSSPELTCFDLVKYIKQSGGINQVATIISQLNNTIDEKKLMFLAKDKIKSAYLQRLGYIFDFLKEKKKANVLKRALEGKKIYPICLVSCKNKKLGNFNKKWKVIVNYKIEVENI